MLFIIQVFEKFSEIHKDLNDGKHSEIDSLLKVSKLIWPKIDFYLFEEPTGKFFDQLGIARFSRILHRVFEEIVFFAQLNRLLPPEN